MNNSINPTDKQLVIRTLKELSRIRMQILMKINMLKRRSSSIENYEDKLEESIKQLNAIENRMDWEINNNGDKLNERL